ncbi:MAG: aldehyde dehydrogenase family protein [Armatimonadetes bacterium]|nr:aldehyde dehydrogenase family protein [Armatimonadota bacterium]
MSFFDALQPEELEAISPYLEAVRFEPGACILHQGTPGDECYLIDQGRVRLELHSTELDSDAVLDYLDAGQVVGEFSLFDRGPRSASAYADTAVAARRLSREGLRRLSEDQPRLGNVLLTYIAQDFTHKLRQMDERLQDFLYHGLAPAWVDGMVERAAAAQAGFAGWPGPRVDALLTDLAERIAGQAEELARAAVAETGLGVVEHKVQKITLACQLTLQALLGRSGGGVTRVDEARRVTELACPMGVVFGLVPLTNPVSTIAFKTMICLKSRNALILGHHPQAMQVGGRVGELIHEVLASHGACEDLLLWVKERASRVTSGAFMTHPGVALILATGGPSMVRAAYSSGTPAIGVGAGNAPVWVCPDADVGRVAATVVASKSFDNGVICGSDNNLVVDAKVRRELVAALEECGAVVLSGYEVDRFTERVIDPVTACLRRELVGRPAAAILQQAGMPRGDQVRLVVLPIEHDKVGGPWGREKLAPIVSLLTVSGVEEGLGLCRHILEIMGAGHTAIIHTHDPDLALRFATEMPASRVLQNCAGATGCIGIGNGLRHSWTLGCGSWGGTSTTDNVGFENLQNIKRLAEAFADAPA